LSGISTADAGSLQALWSRFSAAADPQSFFESWLALLAAQLDSPRRAVLVLGAPATGPFGPVAFYPAGEPCGLFLADLAERALQERRGLYVAEAATTNQLARTGICLPVELDGRLCGAVAVELPGAGQARVLEQMRGLQWGIAWVELWLRRSQAQGEGASVERLKGVTDALAALLAARSLEAGARAFATELASRLNCDRISVGSAESGFARVLALSHAADPGARMNLMRAIEHAMDEAIDQRATIVVPPLADAEPRVSRAHQQLAAAHGCPSVLTVPFPEESGLPGAVTFERAGAQPFDAATVAQCSTAVSLAAHALADKAAAERPLRRAIGDATRSELGRWLGPGRLRRKVTLAIAVIAVVFFSVFDYAFRVTADATIEGTVRRVLVAPFDGYLANAAHRAGDTVKSGALIARLDDRDLQLERMRAQSQLAQYAKQHQDAVAQHDRAQAKILEAQMAQAQAQLTLLEEQLRRARVEAPFDGVLVSGDLSQSLGGTVRRGQVLFEIAPLEGYRVILEADELDIAHLAIGQTGRLIIAALPDQVFPLKVTQITAVSQAREGRTTFRVEAMLEQGSPRLRPGMKGVAKIEAGERKLIWIWTHRALDWLRLWTWTWLAW
jgi:RND family efflux transporter MFP subunit